MNQASRVVLHLGLSFLVGQALLGSQSRADEPEDLEASIRAFETEKRTEIDNAIEEVTEVIAEQRQQLEAIQAVMARSDAALQRLHAMKQALETASVSANAVAEPIPVGQAMPPLPSRSTPDPIALASATDSSTPPPTSCVSPAKPAASWQPGAAVTLGDDVHTLMLPDGTIRVVSNRPMESPRIIREASNLSPLALTDEVPMAAPTQASGQFGALIEALRNVLTQLEAMDGTQEIPPPLSGPVYPSPSSIVPSP
jgi:uncharacterized membrane protein YccC